jgi:hypothetical protein
MARRQLSNDSTDPPELGGAGQAAGAAESQIRNDEIYRMAAFRVRETANRIATLANSARDESLRRELLIVCERLLEEERKLLGIATGGA